MYSGAGLRAQISFNGLEFTLLYTEIPITIHKNLQDFEGKFLDSRVVEPENHPATS